jgi:hypothetical protein
VLVLLVAKTMKDSYLKLMWHQYDVASYASYLSSRHINAQSHCVDNISHLLASTDVTFLFYKVQLVIMRKYYLLELVLIFQSIASSFDM